MMDDDAMDEMVGFGYDDDFLIFFSISLFVILPPVPVTNSLYIGRQCLLYTYLHDGTGRHNLGYGFLPI